MIKNFYNKALFSLFILGLTFIAKAQMTPQQAIIKMSRGINIGNSLELVSPRDVQEYFFTDFKAAGFNCVRIPIRWDLHTQTTAPYTVDSVWLKRVEQIVDWSLKHGLMTIINSHHDDWILNDNSYTATDLARFDSIWSQVAFRFKDKPDSLMFEIANEPNIGISLVDKINAHVISIIRRYNPTRIIVFGSSGTQLSTLKKAVIPKDSFLIASFHTYEPWAFAGTGTGTWGTASQIDAVKSLMTDAAAWSTSHSNIPLLLGEFGTVGKCEAVSRMKWVYTHVEEAMRRNIATAVWSDFGDFGIYNATTVTTNKWNSAIKDILIFTNPLSTESLNVLFVNDSTAQLSWKNRAADYKWIRIERKVGSASYVCLDTLPGIDTAFLDKNVKLNYTYTYRIVCELSTGEITYSLPVVKKIAPPTSVNDLKADDNNNVFDAYIENNHLNIKINSNKVYHESLYNLFTLSGQLITKGSFRTNEIQVNASGLF